MTNCKEKQAEGGERREEGGGRREEGGGREPREKQMEK